MSTHSLPIGAIAIMVASTGCFPRGPLETESTGDGGHQTRDDVVALGGSGGSYNLTARGQSAGDPHPVCNKGWIDFGCDGSLDELYANGCPEGQHLDFEEGNHCASCVPDTPASASCSWGRSRYQAFLTEVTEASCADYCASVNDCSLTTFDSACFTGCSLPLRALIDEEIAMIAEVFGNEACASCEDPPPPCPFAPQGTQLGCSDHRCTAE